VLYRFKKSLFGVFIEVCRRLGNLGSFLNDQNCSMTIAKPNSKQQLRKAYKVFLARPPCALTSIQSKAAGLFVIRLSGSLLNNLLASLVRSDFTDSAYYLHNWAIFRDITRIKDGI